MRTIDQVLAQLDLVKKDISNLKLDDSEYSRLQTKFSEVSSQLAVNQSLSNTISELNKDSTPIARRQSRIEKFIKVVFGGEKRPSSGDSTRWERLHVLDCEPFFLIAASYTPVDVGKMSENDFKCLLATAPTRLNELPTGWLFRKEFQLAVAAHAHVGDMPRFKRRYHELEYDISDVEGSPKRRRIETEQHADDMHEDHIDPDAGQETNSLGYLNGAETSGALGIQTAFDMTPEVFEKIWEDLRHERVGKEHHSIILTIPAEDRVGSIVHSIPRRMAILCGTEYKLPKVSLPQVNLPQVNLPQVNLPQVDLPQVNLFTSA